MELRKRIYYKYIILGLTLFFVIVYFEKTNPNDEFTLTTNEIKRYKLLSENNNTNARIKLLYYYQFAKQDFDKTMEVIKAGAESGDPVFEYKYAQRLLYGKYLTSPLTQDDKKYKNAIRYLEKAAKKGNKDAVVKLEELEKIRVSRYFKILPQR